MIDPRAIIDPSAHIGQDVEIGPWTMIGADVVIEPGARIASHVIVRGPTRIGAGAQIYHFACVGERASERGDRGLDGPLEIGAHNIIREGVTIHRGATTIGDDNVLEAYAHVGAGSRVGDHVTLANGAAIAPRVCVGSWVEVGHMSLVCEDVPPLVVVCGNPARLVGLNDVGLRRAGASDATIAALQAAFRARSEEGQSLVRARRVLAESAVHHAEVRRLMDAQTMHDERGA